ncbi:MAG: aminotransferase class III-fold pyridoxal phosphate-dependent enzyme [Alphaproteobacteria bacterium]|jgi:acetylornithine/N-succinyldiaminopimelate aminotransferase|nr:aminotransferase class III-fold pyridoxal phosphate-dependent enzyme [Alphaproteobacteria bacterium]MBT4083175.1 aminotransferase class III-fold pyridoxal phosphate-dependent enzyme [Alphaproteobacteria bacterium]MBT4546241.1 aminotransferase class III-fold pyridoxal phosphate-dependent enzyme [Alphaproteobacteria bacterium]MBT7747759.1 aminotransferase class III-fold pyridoxal phosphate-dependent enzyme [Alphaproteobacteria bacterium]
MSSILNCTGHAQKIPDIVDSDGAWLTAKSGKRYLDLESGVWCTPLGHKNQSINAAITAQISSITHVGFCYSNDVVEKAGEAVLSITEMTGGRCVFLCSGSEVIELARQMSKHLTQKPTTLCLHDAYFGSFSSTLSRDSGWAVFDWNECADCPQKQTCDRACPKLEAIPDGIAEFVFEPGSSSGFVRFPPKALINNIVGIVRSQGGKIIVNDVTTGMGRTGKWFGYHHYQIEPDFVAIGKGLGNGYPVSALAINHETADQLQSGTFKYMQSHQNDPLGAAVALEVIGQIRKENLIDRAANLGGTFLKELQSLGKNNNITDVRGRGMMFAIDFAHKETGDRIYEQLLEKGYIVCNRGGSFRIDPPLVIEEADFLAFVSVFKQLLTEVD